MEANGGLLIQDIIPDCLEAYCKLKRVSVVAAAVKILEKNRINYTTSKILQFHKLNQTK
jgi:hypothetical protein